MSQKFRTNVSKTKKLLKKLEEEKRRKKRREMGTLVNTRTYTPLAKSLLTKLRYAQRFTLDPSIGATATWVFRANGIFDPDFSGSGHQPLGYDQIMPLYENYCVLGAKITVHFCNVDPNNPMIYGISLQNNATALSGGISQYVEQGKTNYKVASVENGTPQRTLSQTFSAKRFFGVEDPNGTAKYQGSLNANPSDEAYFHVVMAGLWSGSDPVNQLAFVDIEYSVLFSEPNAIAQS